MNYDALIKRAQRAIDEAANRDNAASVHKVDINTDIAKMNGLIVVMHPDFVKTA